MEDKETYTKYEKLKLIVFFIIATIIVILLAINDYNTKQNSINNTIDSIVTDSATYHCGCIYVDSLGWIDEDDYNQMCWDSINK